jgi:hypothetical protein
MRLHETVITNHVQPKSKSPEKTGPGLREHSGKPNCLYWLGITNRPPTGKLAHHRDPDTDLVKTHGTAKPARIRSVRVLNALIK